MKFLIVKLSAIGDVIHSLPVADYLKRAVPGCSVSWLVESASKNLVQNNSAIDQVIVFEGKKWLGSFSKPMQWGTSMSGLGGFLDRIRAEKFDAVIDLQGLLKSSLLGFATGSSRRFGFADTREFADVFLSDKFDVGDYFGHDVPVVELNLKLAQFAVQRLGYPEVPFAPKFPLPTVSAESKAHVESLLSPLVVAQPGESSESSESSQSSQSSRHGKPFVSVLIPGTTWISKIWPQSKWVRLGEELGAKYGGNIIIVGGPSEVQANTELTDELSQKLSAHGSTARVSDFTGKTSLLDLITLFRNVDLVVGGDTGPLHIAAAVETPAIVGVFGATPWRRNGPYGAHCKTVSLSLDCQPCYSKKCRIKTVACLNDLEPQLVMNAADELLA